MHRVAAIGLAFVVSVPGAAAQTQLHKHLGSFEFTEPRGISADELNDLASIAQRSGSTADLDPLCSSMELDHVLSNCQFRQLSAVFKDGDDNRLVFNVPKGANPPPFVIVFHFGKRAGEIYLVSMSGNLVRAYVRGGDGQFELRESAEIKQRFLIDMTYWSRHAGEFYGAFKTMRPENRE